MRLIDADALIAYCDKKWIPLNVDAVNAQPTIEPRKGRWLPENRTMDAFWVCSACGFPSEAFAANKLYKFCPNCGADMREVTE